ncbi:MAG: SURF1 family protein [Nitrosomonas sp.]|nr:SURF1 family protein [Nitrosomonas sp.]
MTLAGFEFRPKLWVAVITVCFVIIFIKLGNWQLSRADERNSRHERLEQLSKEPSVIIPGSHIKLDDYLYRQVEVSGNYLSEKTIFLDNKTYKGHAGYHVITPILIAQSEFVVAINRGWVPMGSDRSIVPVIDTSEKSVTIHGIASSPEIRTFALADQEASSIVWNKFDLDRFQQMAGYDVQPVMILQESKVDDGLIRDWVRPESGASKNIGYAVQWFSLAATTIIIFLILNVKRSKQKVK